jgi:hypothetical protein
VDVACDAILDLGIKLKAISLKNLLKTKTDRILEELNGRAGIHMKVWLVWRNRDGRLHPQEPPGRRLVRKKAMVGLRVLVECWGFCINFRRRERMADLV